MSKSLIDSNRADVTVGRFVKIQLRKVLLIGVITDVSIETSPAAREQGLEGTARIDLMGEIIDHDDSRARFRRGVTDYPTIGDPVALLTNSEMRIIFDSHESESIN